MLLVFGVHYVWLDRTFVKSQRIDKTLAVLVAPPTLMPGGGGSWRTSSTISLPGDMSSMTTSWCLADLTSLPLTWRRNTLYTS